jgi:hypothetical protein
MCDYSLHCVESRPAKIDDRLVTRKFPGTMTRGFAAADNPAVAICLRPGTELAFEQTTQYRGTFGRLLPFLRSKSAGTLARFRQINAHRPNTHHDALEFADGTIVLLTRLAAGQVAAILQMPGEPEINAAEHQKHSTARSELIETH